MRNETTCRLRGPLLSNNFCRVDAHLRDMEGNFFMRPTTLLLVLFFLGMATSGCSLIPERFNPMYDPTAQYGTKFQQEDMRSRITELDSGETEMCKKYYGDMNLEACKNARFSNIVRVRVVDENDQN